MRVFLRPEGLHSRAMVRVARALARRAPAWAEIVAERSDADLQVVHVIGTGSLEDVDPEKPYVFIQYCALSAGKTLDMWAERWKRCAFVWSYFDLLDMVQRDDFNFYRAPLGIDPAFVAWKRAGDRDIGVMTSGYVSHPAAEAIEEVAVAAHHAGLSVVHLGPSKVEGFEQPPPGWAAVEDISDARLADLYGWSRWVSGLRHVEGFEMPVIEGLACGARPIVFDRRDMRHWYDGHAIFVPEASGVPLVEMLTEVFKKSAPAVKEDERARVLAKFNWDSICAGFWQCVESSVAVAA